MSDNRVCIHIWRRRGRWFSHTRGKDIWCCRKCRKKWARARIEMLKARAPHAQRGGGW